MCLVACSSERNAPPYTPEEALETFEIHPDFAVELYAAEPLVTDPVAIDFGPNGEVWVVENSGYPLDVEGHRGRVKRLRDTDGDGRPDRADVFIDKLVMPTGVMAWKNGVLVTDPPEVVYFEDSDGDGVADVRRTLLAGFAFGNPQHTVSSPVYGLDNWIYLSHDGSTRSVVFSDLFDQGSEIHFPEKPDGPRFPVARRSVRFKPGTFELEMLAGPSQFGTAFGPFGDVFPHNNSNHVRHEPIDARYLERNPAFRLGEPWDDMFVDGHPAEVYPITLDPRFEMLTNVGVMTSASGLTRYLGGAFPGHEDLAVVAEPAHNLVHADRWSPKGSTYEARRLHPADREFLASTDAWFRPVNFTIGPDGALYLVDYYRRVIEHPEWTSDELYESEELYDGDDRGRIWRITPAGGLPFVRPAMGEAADAERVARLADPNVWYRRTAQRLLVERGAVDPALLRENPPDSAAGRAHRLWTLEGLGELEWSDVTRGLGDPDPDVARTAVRLAEPFRETARDWLEKLLAVEANPDPRVRLQLLLTLGDSSDARARAFRDRALAEGLDDPWIQAAALTWPDQDPVRLLTRAKPGEAGERFVRRLASMAGAAEDSGAERLLAAVARDDQPWRQAAALRGLAESVEARDVSSRRTPLELATSSDPAVREAALALIEEIGLGESAATVAAKAAKTAFDASKDAAARAEALRLLALADPAPYREPLEALLAAPATAEDLQAAAARAYGAIDGVEPAAFLVERIRALLPGARSAALDAFAQSDARSRVLLDAIESGEVSRWMLDFSQMRRLVMHEDPGLRARAHDLLEQAESDRRHILEGYRKGLAETQAEAARGRTVFQRVCRECHQFRGEGEEVGPDLATVATRPAAAILADILLPNQSIAQTYEAYVVELEDGRIIDGVIGPQTPTTVTLRREGGVEDVIERDQIKSMRATQLSAMPENMEDRVSVTDMAHLIRYIKSR